jgi:AraC family transcriptional regulator
MTPREPLRPRTTRVETDEFHRRIVDRALAAIRMRFAEEDLRLSGIAAAAISSPFHFARLFRQIAGVPPGHFLTAVRMQAAKRLLAETGLSVTNVCLEVGYSSIGTFTRRFTELVGVGPRAFRRLSGASAAIQDAACHRLQAGRPAFGRSVCGMVRGPSRGPIAIGLFRSPLAQGHPVRCCIVKQAGPFRINGVPDGRFFVMAAALDSCGRLSEEPEFRGAAAAPVDVTEGSGDLRVDIELRPPEPTDPPIVVCIPVLAVMAIRAGMALKAGSAPRAVDSARKMA